MAIKLTKNELKKQKDNLKQFERYLPTLQLKKQQLQTVIMKIRADLAQKEEERLQMIGDLDDWVAVFGENEIFDEELRLDKLVQPDRVVTKEENIAGVKIPAFEELTFKDIDYNVDEYPLWVDTAVYKLRGIARLDALVSTLRKQVQLLVDEAVLKAEWVGCHPCINTSSLRIRATDLFGRVLEAAEHGYIVVRA